MTPPDIAFVDLKAQRRHLGHRIDQALQRVLDHSQFIMGPEVRELESQLARFTGAKVCLTCANGTDALALALMAWEIGPGDAVLVPAFTFVSTAEVVALVGATPVFVDVCEDDYNIDPDSLTRGVTVARAQGLRPRVVIPVDLFGQPANYDSIHKIAREEDLWVLADAAQSFGARCGMGPVGRLGHVTTTSFFPAKPLGCYGDGGAILTDDETLAGVIRSLRNHGQGSNKYDNVRIGLNSRLDTLQAAILIEKMAVFPTELSARQTIADRYTAALAPHIKVPRLRPGNTSSWAQYTLQSDKRDAVVQSLKAAQVPTAVYYPIPLTQQAGYKHFPVAEGGAPNAEALSRSVFSLPMHPYLESAVQDYIVDQVRMAG